MRGKFKRILSLRTVKSIKFVQFELRRSQLVNIRKENDLPPEALREEYMYNPMPADMIPPLGENYMMHLFSHPDHADPRAKEDLDRIPKKLKDRLAICAAQGKGIGWGVHFVEGWHLSALSLVAYVVFLIASLIFLVCWAVLKQDVQGASGVAAYILALTTLSVGTLQAAFELELLWEQRQYSLQEFEKILPLPFCSFSLELSAGSTYVFGLRCWLQDAFPVLQAPREHDRNMQQDRAGHFIIVVSRNTRGFVRRLRNLASKRQAFL